MAMLVIILIYLGLNLLFIVVMGFLQTPTSLPDVKTPPESEMCSVLAIAAIVIQAFLSVILLAGTGYYPAAAGWLAFTLLCHHTVIHRNSRFEGETCSCAPFQCKDICNHETWVIAALVSCIVSGLNM
jgi:uncharacterized membrane protein YphA (DoxX/SURF4 family)